MVYYIFSTHYRPLFDHETEGAVSMAFLPWAHVFGQTVELYGAMATGSSVGIVSDREQILEGFGLIQPTMLCVVPMLLNKVCDLVHCIVLCGAYASE